MAAEKNQQYLLLQADSRVCGIHLMKLIKPKEEQEEALDWENKDPLPFDFSVNLPLEHMHILDFDSKIVLIGGCKFFFKYSRHSGPKHSKKVYELDLENRKVVESESIEDAEHFFDSTMHHRHKIENDYYFITMTGNRPMGCHANFRVLRSRPIVSGRWGCLPNVPDDPFSFLDSVVDDSSPPLPRTVESSFFDFYGMLYLRMRMADERIFIFTYDTHNPLKDWTMTEGDDSFTHSFCVEVGSDYSFLQLCVFQDLLSKARSNKPLLLSIVTIIGIGVVTDLVDSGKYLALSCEHIGGKNMIYAFLVDQLGVCNFQTIEGCFKRVPPSFIYKKLPRLVSFGGKGVVGVMISGSREEKEKRIPVLSVRYQSK
ncbi:hypothetical protein PIB30_005891 [Stylosanthes scabra]|uniref:F-box protein n=1 Tax=Stylosanthes scabra TaxID=79078 RepID=A0ABU6Q477_9FABA|nr:hypothetical protein [Stylosanthes scabra]